MRRRDPGYWNVWWTLTILALVFTFAVVVLESIGVFHDVGILLSAFGLLVGIFFGLTASTRSSVTMLGAQVRGVADDVRSVGDDVRSVGGDVRTVAAEVRIVAEELRAVRSILEERLPRLT